jgi:orotidine-5'-phosphate decarboxylase
VKSEHFSDRLVEAISKIGAPTCVGLDPVLEKIPASIRESCSSEIESISRFCSRVISVVSEHAAAIKLQSACFERWGARGIEARDRCMAEARSRGCLVILDAKRGDIGVTAEHYSAMFEQSGADAITLSGYLGPDTIEPFARPGRGLFVLVRTSNPGSDDLQSARLDDGRMVCELVAEMVAALGAKQRGKCGLSDIGAVVGATQSADARTLRSRMPDQFFLAPGYGAQGGTLDDIRPMLRPRAHTAAENGVLVTASRSVVFPFSPNDVRWEEKIRNAATEFRNELAKLTPRDGSGLK